MQMLYRCFMLAGYRPNAVYMQWIGAEVVIANHERMSVYLAVYGNIRLSLAPEVPVCDR